MKYEVREGSIKVCKSQDPHSPDSFFPTALKDVAADVPVPLRTSTWRTLWHMK